MKYMLDVEPQGIKESLPSRERGLKYLGKVSRQIDVIVAPLAGAWVEILRRKGESVTVKVAPLAGAWVEIG